MMSSQFVGAKTGVTRDAYSNIVLQPGYKDRKASGGRVILRNFDRH